MRRFTMPVPLTTRSLIVGGLLFALTTSCQNQPSTAVEESAGSKPASKKVAVKKGHGLLRVNAAEPLMVFVDNLKMGLGKNLSVPVATGLRTVNVFPHRHPPQFFQVEIKEGEERTIDVAFNETPEERWKAANDPKKPLYWVLHAAASREKGKYAAAESLLRFALQSHPKDKQLWRQLAYTLPALKKKEAALNAIERYLELEPNAPDRAHLLTVQKRLAPQMDDSFERGERGPVKGPAAP